MKTRWWLVAVLVASIGLPGCGRAPDVDRDNRRVLEEILTAITLSNARLLEDSAKRARKRFEMRHLTDAEYSAMQSIVNKARGGDWGSAESDAYKFRKEHPFVKR
jgi:hypothetical protein